MALDVIGLSGFARSGKDTVGEILVRNGYTRVSFADPMRDALLALNPLVIDEDGNVAPLYSVITLFGWERYKESGFGDDIRGLLQRFGTEVGRVQWGEDFWVDQALAKARRFLLQGQPVVFTDVRFWNEAQAIQELGGEVWRVRRPNVFPANDHASENELTSFSFDDYIDNNDSLESLKVLVEDRLGS